MKFARLAGRMIIYILLSGFFCSVVKAQAPPVLAEKDKVAYLFVYFTGNRITEEAIRYAISKDGFQYFALNNNHPVIDSKKISSSGGVRDPHILRAEDGKTFYMVATDMVSAKGWDANRAMTLMKSTDLINWTSSVINIQQQYKGHEDLKRVWAPQTIYDEAAGKYMVYWSMKHGDKHDIIYYAYANREFTALEGEPKPLFIPATPAYNIDADIVKKDSLYYLFRKTGGADGAGIKVATTALLTSGKWTENEQYVQPTKLDVEGSSVFKLNNWSTYIMMYDLFKAHGFQFTRSQDLRHFEIIDKEVKMDFKPRHGSVIALTGAEVKALINKWGKPAGFPSMDNNPVLAGYYADPDVLYSHKTKKYYIYPTSDGFTDWKGTYFKTFSSPDLQHWKDEGMILQLGKDVSWADRNAWAPCIEEKKIKGRYKYFYYFTAAQKIGVAVADDPAGPFVDLGKPLIDERPEGIRRGQVIDPDVFTDPRSGKSYLYWGNGFMAAAELNSDMTSLKKETLTILNPDKTFREGTYVFYRKGTYYFLWSENDTRDADYRVRYATAASPLGPLTIPKENLVIAKDTAAGIYGTGHNSVLQIPGKDEWYIVYHRFEYPNGIHMGRSAGYNRELCIDKMEFNVDGSIKQVVPTHKGIR
ncbi:family 43 glycosylhydrolase [Longitalea luteola]|uniref:family 43 glycosylhydrolase n=1 Tax=Longitalea luteola TaxID=2812563 RepID=UPI001F609B93|nr:family 43 glycosylhydrolase [Longitalea luteola]